MVQQEIGLVEISDAFGAEEGGQASLPELVAAFDFAFGLGSRGIAEGDVARAQGGGELGKAVGEGR